MSAFSRNAVYTRIVKAVKATYSNIYYSGMLEPVPASFPALYVREIGYTTPVEYETLAVDSSQWISTFEVQVYSDKANDSISEAYGIMEIVKTTFKTLGYICDMLEPMQNVDTSVYRLIGRWHRQIGGADVMPAAST